MHTIRKKTAAILILCFAVQLALSSAAAADKSEKMIGEAREYFHQSTGFSGLFIDQFFTHRVEWLEEREVWHAVFTYHDIYDDRFSEACLGHTYSGRVKDPIKPPEFIAIFDKERKLINDLESDASFPMYLERYMIEADNWYRMERIKEQKGYHAEYGRVWQFWPPEIKYGFFAKYGHPSGFLNSSEILSPEGVDLSWEAALDLVRAIAADERLDIDVDRYYADITLMTLPCSAVHDEDPTWIIRLYSQDGEEYREEYMIDVCAVHRQVDWIQVTGNTYIDRHSSKHTVDEDKFPVHLYNRWVKQ